MEQITTSEPHNYKQKKSLVTYEGKFWIVHSSYLEYEYSAQLLDKFPKSLYKRLKQICHLNLSGRRTGSWTVDIWN